MTGFIEQDNILGVENVSFADIALETGTPTYVYSKTRIAAQYQRLKDALKSHLPADKQPLLCYACKANSNLAILRLIKNLGCGLEIVSEGELRKGLKAGFRGNQIISTSFGKTAAEIKACLEADILQFNIESLQELENVNFIAAQMDKVARVLFRLNPNITGGGHHKISTGRKRDKFGLGPEKIFECYEIATKLTNIEPVGLSVHIGSQVSNVEAFKPAFEKLAEMTRALRKDGYVVNVLDIGGGFPVIYNDEKLLDLESYAHWVNETIVPLDTDIQMEPGRYLVAEAGVLLTEVLYVKETQDRRFLVLDSAMNDLIRPTLYEAWHGIEPVENRDRPKQSYDVVGPICESGDLFAEARKIPEMKAGELAVIRTAGAYGFSMASNYNARPLPAEVLVDGDRFAIIRKRQSFESLMCDEILPDWL